MSKRAYRYPRNLPRERAALRSDNDRCLLNQMRVHDENIGACEKCKGLKCRNHCLQVEDMTRSEFGRRRDGGYDYYLHKGCEIAHADYAGI